MWLRGLRQDLRRTQSLAFAQGTLRNLKTQLHRFSEFSYKSALDGLPVSTDTLCLYIQYLTRSLSSPQSITNYVSGLRTFHKLLDLPFPSTSDIQVRLTVKGVNKCLSHTPHQASPITPSILSSLHTAMDLQDEFHIVFWCLFLFMFFLFARKSQFLPTSRSVKDVGNLVRRQDVEFKDGVLQVKFNWTKTRQSGGVPLLIPLVSVPGSPLCPVSAFTRMVAAVPAPGVSPLFVLPGPKGHVPVVYSYFHKVFRILLDRVGLPSHQYSSHSFRRGGATFAFSIGVPGELIQSQGDWKSDAYKLYLDMSYAHRVEVASAMASRL